jgi:hypothetical protein
MPAARKVIRKMGFMRIFLLCRPSGAFVAVSTLRQARHVRLCGGSLRHWKLFVRWQVALAAGAVAVSIGEGS